MWVCLCGLTCSDKSLVGGDGLTLSCEGRYHNMVHLITFQVVHSEFRAGCVGLQHQRMVMKTGHRYFKVGRQLWVWDTPSQPQAVRGDIRDVQHVWVVQKKKAIE